MWEIPNWLNDLNNQDTQKNTSEIDIQTAWESLDLSNKLSKINDILDDFWVSKEDEDKYRDILLKQDKIFLEELQSKPKDEILKFLIQEQIKEIESSNNPDFNGLDELQDTLISLQKDETQANNETINNNQEIKEQLNSIQNSLTWLSNNKNAEEILNLINQAQNLQNEREELSSTGTKELSELMQEKLDEILEILHNPVALTTIVNDLKEYDEKNSTNRYETFKNSIIWIDSSLKEKFESIELDSISNIAQLKLWVSDLNGVNLSNDTLIKQDWDFEIKANSDSRSLSLQGSDYEIQSDINPKNEFELRQINQETNQELKPLNEYLDNLSSILDFVEKAKETNIKFNDFKEQLKNENSILYNVLGLENKNSYDEVIFVINNKKTELEKLKEEKIKKSKERVAQLIAQNEKEIKEQDERKKQTLIFLNSIGFDLLSKDRITDIVIEYINRNKARFDLAEKMDLQNWVLGFDKDFWNNEINAAEKLAFIRLFNKMLWEDIIDENIANGITSLSLKAISRIQVLNNRTTWFFLANLESKS